MTKAMAAMLVSALPLSRNVLRDNNSTDKKVMKTKVTFQSNI